MDPLAVRQTILAQSGVVSRRQVIAHGGDDNDIERLLRRREWSRIHHGVYVDHTGPPSWLQRAWAGVLYHWPACLAGRSALRAHGLRGPDGQATDHVHVAIADHRRVACLPDVRVQRVADFDHIAQMHLSPPRLRIEQALLDVAADSSRESDVVAILGDACQQRRTTPVRLNDALVSRPRLRHRRLIRTILADVASGAYSALERRYLIDVERPHGLPTARRQRMVRHDRGTAFRDVEYLGLAVVVELDGRLGHEWALDRWADMDRDIESTIHGAVTLRVGWQQALDPCRTAAAVGRLLVAQGWASTPRGCGTGCPAASPVWVRGDLPAPGAGRSPQTA